MTIHVNRSTTCSKSSTLLMLPSEQQQRPHLTRHQPLLPLPAPVGKPSRRHRRPSTHLSRRPTHRESLQTMRICTLSANSRLSPSSASPTHPRSPFAGVFSPNRTLWMNAMLPGSNSTTSMHAERVPALLVVALRKPPRAARRRRARSQRTSVRW